METLLLRIPVTITFDYEIKNPEEVSEDESIDYTNEFFSIKKSNICNDLINLPLNLEDNLHLAFAQAFPNADYVLDIKGDGVQAIFKTHFDNLQGMNATELKQRAMDLYKDYMNLTKGLEAEELSIPDRDKARILTDEIEYIAEYLEKHEED